MRLVGLVAGEDELGAHPARRHGERGHAVRPQLLRHADARRFIAALALAQMPATLRVLARTSGMKAVLALVLAIGVSGPGAARAASVTISDQNASLEFTIDEPTSNLGVPN